MDPSFRFDPDGSDDEAAGRPAQGKPAQSAWDLSSYAESVAAEHALRRTTSIDEKISQARQGRRKPVLPDDSEDYESGGSGEDDGDDEDEEALVEGESSGDEEDELEVGEDDEEEALEGSGDEEVEAESDGEEDKGVDEEEGGEQEEEDGEEEEHAQEWQEDDNTEQDGKLEPSKFFASSEGASFHANSFLELNLSRPLVRACEALGYQKPTPIQAACIPLALTGRDICGSAITGSGKTAAFALPVLERLLFRPKRVPAIRVLILTPTRELAAQIHSMIEKLAQFTDIRCCLIVGGLSVKKCRERMCT